MKDFIKKVPWPVWLALSAVALYLGWNWYKNRQTSGTGPGVPQLGTNLNSIAPELIGGASGPSSGLNYYAGAENITITGPVEPPAPVMPPAPGPQPPVRQKPINVPPRNPVPLPVKRGRPGVIL